MVRALTKLFKPEAGTTETKAQAHSEEPLIGYKQQDLINSRVSVVGKVAQWFRVSDRPCKSFMLSVPPFPTCRIEMLAPAPTSEGCWGGLNIPASKVLKCLAQI